jgi:hypothetical protein
LESAKEIADEDFDGFPWINVITIHHLNYTNRKLTLLRMVSLLVSLDSERNQKFITGVPKFIFRPFNYILATAL